MKRPWAKEERVRAVSHAMPRKAATQEEKAEERQVL
jgi:hypothetical protein